MTQVSWPILLLLFVVAVLVVMGPRLWHTFGPRFGRFAGEAYQKRMITQLKAKYPKLAERLDGYDLGPASQEAFQGAMKRLPPQKAMELQLEFNRLRENFMARHPELAPVLNAGQDPKEQVKAMNTVMNFPDDQRAAIEKDLLWAWDQLRGRYPALMGPIESALKRKADTPVAT